MLSTKIPPICSEFTLSRNIRATTNSEDALKNTSVIVHAIPLQSTEQFLYDVIEHIPTNGEIVFVSTSKGIETETLELPCHLLERVLYRQKEKSRRRRNVKLAYLSGPTFAKQLINETPSGAVMAARTLALSRKACGYFASPVALVLSVHGRRRGVRWGRVEERGGDFSRWFRGDGVWCERGGVISNEGL